MGWKRHEHDILWHDELWRTVPAGTVEDRRVDGPDAGAWADSGQMFVHGLDAGCRRDQGGAGAARRAIFDKLRWRRTGSPPPAMPPVIAWEALAPPAGCASWNLWLASPSRAASARNRETLGSWRVISMTGMPPAPRINGVPHRVTFAAVWESPRSQVLGRLV
ncbi:MAG: hypothetical protein ACREDM_05080 [Methylocella sp.]